MTPIPYDFKPAAAVAAVVMVGCDRYLLQHRDSRPGIWYPGLWGLFGGEVEAGESTEDALRRELGEELGLIPRRVNYFLDVRFNFSFARGQLSRSVYEVEVEADELTSLELREGAGAGSFAIPELAALRIVPNDLFVLDIHISRRGRQ